MCILYSFKAAVSLIVEVDYKKICFDAYFYVRLDKVRIRKIIVWYITFSSQFDLT